MAKLPQHVILTFFNKLIPGASQISSSVFLLNGKCPICKDYKKRLYLKEYNDEYMIYCHNCGYSNSFGGFVKHEYPEEWNQMKIHFLESIKDGSAFTKPKVVKKKTMQGSDNKKLYEYLNKKGFIITQEQRLKSKENYRLKCIHYLQERKIPKEIYEDFWCMRLGPLAGYIGIPFFDKDKKKLLHVQGRQIIKNKQKPKYLFLKDEEEGIIIDSKPMWGLWRVDKRKPVKVCEGTLDACAFTNSVAVCGITMSDYFIRNIKAQFPKIIWCLDNYFKDKEGKKRIEKLLLKDEVCFCVPKSMNSKDGNDLLKELNVDVISDRFVFENCFKGKTGLTKLKLSCLKTG